MSELTQTLVLFGLVCLMSYGVIAYVLIKGDWWRS